MKTKITPGGYYSESEMSEFLDKTISSLRADHCRRSEGVPPKTKLGRKVVYSKESFETWMKSREVNSDRLRKRK